MKDIGLPGIFRVREVDEPWKHIVKRLRETVPELLEK
jgi:hypothetical protein